MGWIVTKEGIKGHAWVCMLTKKIQSCKLSNLRFVHKSRGSSVFVFVLETKETHTIKYAIHFQGIIPACTEYILKNH